MGNKTIILLLLLLSCIGSIVHAEIDADVHFGVYYQDELPYLEVSLHIVGSTLEEKIVTNAGVETRVNVLVTVKADEQIVDFEKYALRSPLAKNPSDFIDLRRFVLPPGNYTVEIKIVDQLKKSNQFNLQQEITIAEWKQEMFVSPISLLSNVKPSREQDNPFFKYGNLMEPAAFHFFHQQMNKLYVFSEIYNADQSGQENLAVKLSIENLDNDIDPIVKYKRFKSSSKEVFIDMIPIVELSSGNYKLIFQVVNSAQEVMLEEERYFQRSNPQKDRDLLINSEYDLEGNFINSLTPEELEYNLIALSPRLPPSDQVTVNLLLSENNIKGQKFFLYNYWVTVDPVTTEETFRHYEKIAQAVDNKFYNAVGRGFQTDRGYIFLKYGRPDNMIAVENEPSAPPYEIWFYDKLDLTGEVNVRFLFYNPSLAGYDFQLLHSTSRNEKQNRQWELELYSDAVNEIDGNRVDATRMKDNLNRRAREYFEDTN